LVKIDFIHQENFGNKKLEIMASGNPGEKYAIDGNRVFCNCPGGSAMIDCTEFKSKFGAPNCDKCRRKHGGCSDGGVANNGGSKDSLRNSLRKLWR
jgi:hypothetical protein